MLTILRIWPDWSLFFVIPSIKMQSVLPDIPIKYVFPLKKCDYGKMRYFSYQTIDNRLVQNADEFGIKLLKIAVL